MTGTRNASASCVTACEASAAPCPHNISGRRATRRRSSSSSTSGAGIGTDGSDGDCGLDTVRRLLGDLDHHGPGLVTTGEVERVAHRPAKRRGPHRPRSTAFTSGSSMAAWGIACRPGRTVGARRDGSGDDVDERRGVEPGLGEPGDRVGEPGASDREQHGRTPRRACVAVRHERRRQLARAADDAQRGSRRRQSHMRTSCEPGTPKTWSTPASRSVTARCSAPERLRLIRRVDRPGAPAPAHAGHDAAPHR